MAWKSNKRRIQEALEGGLVRKESLRAEPKQALTFVLSDRKLFPHATLDSAREEKEFLNAALGRRMRIYKVWNTSGSKVKADMALLRFEAERLSKQTALYQVLDRVLIGAGY